MKKVWVRSPDGETREVDPKEYDVPAMLKAGFEVTTRPEPAALHYLPAVGGIVGGIVGGGAGAAAGGIGAFPGAVGGAALGGAGGEAMRQNIGRMMGVAAPETPQEALGAIGQEGAWQGVNEATGIGLAKGAGMVAKPLMQAALKATPEVAQTALREGVLATRGGLKAVEQKLGQLGERTKMMIRQNRASFDPATFLAGAEQSLAKTLRENATPDAVMDFNTFKRMSSRFLQVNQRPLSALALQKLKQDADNIAKPLWNTIAKGEPLSPVKMAKARWYKAVADHARRELENTTPNALLAGRNTSLREANKETSEVIGLKDALGKRVRRGTGIGARLAGHSVGATVGGTAGYFASGHNPLGAGTGALLGLGATSPEALSLLARTLDGGFVPDVLARQAPRAVTSFGTPSR